MKISESTYFPDAKELTRHGFVSHMEDYIGKLIGENPLGADVDDYLKGFGIDAPKAIEMLTKPEIEGFPESAAVVKTERIKSGYDENGRPMKDKFQVIYKVPKRNPELGIKGIDEKLRNLYIKAFENHEIKGTVLNEDDGGCAMGGDGGNGPGATTTFGDNGSNGSGQFTTPLFGMVRKKGYSPKNTSESRERKTMYITEEQLAKLKEAVEMDTRFGDFGYDAPPFSDDETMDHDDMLDFTKKKNQAVGHKSLEEGDSGIHIKKSHEGKFTALKKRTGKSSTWYKEHGTPAQKRMATFALNAKKWNHE